MKSENFNLITIADLVKEGAIVEIQDGNHGEKHPKTSDYVDDGVPFIMANNITGNRVDIDGAQKISPVLADSLRIGFAKTGDVLLTHKGTIGSTAIVDTTLPYLMLTPQVTYYRTNPEKLRNRYLMYAFREELFQKTIISLAQQATRPYIGITAQRRLKIRWKPIDQQDRVVEILSAYDDLIENNRRRIQLLEQAARLLYKEWFVHLRFPGHEHTQIIDGVPESWEKKPLREIADVTMGQSPKSIYYNNDGNGLPFHQGVTNFGVRFPTHETYCTVQSRIAEPGDILFSVRAPVGRMNITPDKIVIGRGLAAIRSICDHQNYLFYALKSHFFKEDMIGGGAIFAAITKKDLYGVELIKPTDRIAAMFMEHVVPIDLQIANLHQTIERLTKARDLLLPKLMNGEVEV